MKQINFERDNIVWSDSCEAGAWYCVEGLYSWGLTLEELIENAYAVKTDQDGGEMGFVAIEELPESAVEMLREFWGKNGTRN